MEVVSTVAALRARVAGWRGDGAAVGLAPTMGGLHEGHASLVRAAKEAGQRAVATIFVNPAQFGPGEDLSACPQAPDADAAVLEAAGADLLFLPDPAEIYPPGFATRVAVERFADILCALNRPGHFDGVALVMTKLLNMAQADTCYMGEKDWQQLQVVRQAARDLNLGTRIVGCPTLREADGLALSTRNACLTPAEREVAPRLHAELAATAERIADGAPTELACAEAQENLVFAGFARVEYLECRHAETLRLAPSPGKGARVFAAAVLGRARLIDNVPVPG